MVSNLRLKRLFFKRFFFLLGYTTDLIKTTSAEDGGLFIIIKPTVGIWQLNVNALPTQTYTLEILAQNDLLINSQIIRDDGEYLNK